MANEARLNELSRAAVSAGVLPEGAVLSSKASRPWPVVLLTALGAWLAAIPLLGVFGLLFGSMFQIGAGPYFCGVLLIAAAAVILRSRDLPVFVEQLAIPALVTGGASLAIGLFRDVPAQAAAALMCLVALVVAWAIPRAWLRVLLGAAAGIFASMAIAPTRWFVFDRGASLQTWFGLHASLLAMLALMQTERRWRSAAHARLGAALESTGTGWVIAGIVMLAWWSGMTFLASGVLGTGFAAGLARELAPGLGAAEWTMRGASIVLALAAAGVLASRWTSLRGFRAALAAIVVASLCWFMTTLGAVLLAMAWAAVTRRWRIVALAAVAAAWIVGAFYYRLDWPLATKALVLVGAGAVLAALAWSRAGRVRAQGGTRMAMGHAAAAWIASGALVTIAFANYAIYEKEQLIAGGDKVYVRLAPVDPRSLMQGDFMRLNYRLPSDAGTLDRLSIKGRPYVVVKRDARGVAEPVRVVKTREPLAGGEMNIELTPREGGWVLVSDAWHFAEGDGARWAPARYAEFRVMPDGRALLVGLADEQLKTIPAKP